MSDKMLRLQVVFAALDKLSAPMRKLRAGSKGLAESMADTRKQIAGLKKAQLQLAQFRGAEGRFQKSAAELATLTGRVTQLREEIAKVDAPTKKMAAALAAAEKAEATAIARHEEHGRRLQELSRGLEAAGADVTDLARHEDRLADQLREANREFERQHELSQRIQRMRQRGEAVRNVGGRIAAGGAATTALVTAPIIALGKKAFDDASEAAELQSAYDAVFKGMTRSMNAWAVATGDKMGRSTQEMQRGAMTLGMLFNQAAPTRKAAAGLSKEFAVLAQDLSSFFNTSPEEALEKVRAGLTGEAEPLRAFGVFLTDAAVKAKAAQMGLAKSGEELTEQQKILARAALIKDATVDAHGDVAKTFNGTANQIRRAKGEWEELSVAIGSKLLPALTPVITQVANMLASFSRLSPSTQKFVLMAILAAAVLGPLITAIGGVIAAIGGIITIISAVATALAIGFGAAAAIVGGVVLAIAGLIAIGVLIYRNWGPISAFFLALWERIKAIVSAAIAVLGAIIMNFTPVGLFVRAFTSVFTYLRSLVPSWSTVGRMMLEGLLSALSPARLVMHVLRLGGAAIKAIKGVLGIKSPSRVFAGIGGHMMEGLQLGLDRGADGPIARIRRAGAELTGALSGSMLLAAPAAAGIAPAQAQPAAMGTRIYEVHFHLPPGQHDPQAIAEAVREEIDRLERAEASAARATFRDED